MKDNESNRKKSINGYDFNYQIKDILESMLKDSYIKSYTSEPRYNYPGYLYNQFSPDGEIILNDNSIIVIDNTTSARHDRFKQKQWDAYGVKCYFRDIDPKLDVKYFVILPNTEDLGSDFKRQYELRSLEREQRKILSGKYYSEISAILQVKDLVEFIMKSNTL